MAATSTTRGVPFDPAAAKQQRENVLLAARQLDEEAKRKAHQEKMRAHGRALDEEQRELRRQRRRQEDQMYEERFGKQKRFKRNR